MASVALPLPSSPHWAPISTIAGMRQPPTAVCAATRGYPRARSTTDGRRPFGRAEALQQGAAELVPGEPRLLDPGPLAPAVAAHPDAALVQRVVVAGPRVPGRGDRPAVHPHPFGLG